MHLLSRITKNELALINKTYSGIISLVPDCLIQGFDAYSAQK